MLVHMRRTAQGGSRSSRANISAVGYRSATDVDPSFRLSAGLSEEAASRVVNRPGGVFSSSQFLGALNRTWFAGLAHEADVRVGDVVVHTLVAGGEPVLDATFLDFFLPVHVGEATVRGRYAPRVAHGVFPAAERSDVDPLVVEPAPFIDLASFATWDDVQAHWKQTEKGAVRESRRRARRLERDVGPLCFQLRDPSDEAFDACIAWKSEQFRSAGVESPLDDPREVELLRALVEDGVGVVSSLRAGDRVIASHIGLDFGNTMHWWLPTYDRELRSLSPGRLLLEWVIQQCYERGDPVFDFLRGDADYKWIYATHFRKVQEAGTRPLRRQLELARGRAVRRMPRAAEAARRVRDVARSQQARVRDLRPNGSSEALVQSLDGAPVLVVSPHLDDAVLSAFGFLDRPDVTVMTVFTGAPEDGVASEWDRKLGHADGAEIMRRRLAEDDAALESMRVPTVRLGLLEAGYRDGDLPEHDAESLRAAVREWLAGTDGNGVVLAPSGAGAVDNLVYRLRWRTNLPIARFPGGGLPHPDHVATRDVVVPEVLAAGHRVVLYEELPYCWSGRGDRRVAQLVEAGLPQPQRFHLRVDPRRKAAAVARYESQTPELFRPWVRDIASVMPSVERYWLVTPSRPRSS